MDPAVRERVKKKFDISFVLAKEHPAIHELAKRHGVDLGQHTRIEILPTILFTTLLRAKGSNCMLAWHHVTIIVS